MHVDGRYRLRSLALAIATCGCTLISLDPLQDGAGGSNTGGDANGAGPQGGTNAGGDGNGGDGASTSEGGNGANGGGPPVTYEDCILADDPAVFFSMNGQDTEENLGALRGTATYNGAHTTAGPLVVGGDEAAKFIQGAGNDLTFAGASSIFGGYKPFTIELWLEMADRYATVDLVRFTDGSNRLSLILYERQIETGLDSFILRIHEADLDEREASFPLDLLVPPMQRRHVVAIYHQLASTEFEASGAAEDMTLYVDGAVVADHGGGDMIPMPTIDGTLLIGNGFTGTIDDVAIYDRVLTAAEVTEHWLAGTGEATCAL